MNALIKKEIRLLLPGFLLGLALAFTVWLLPRQPATGIRMGLWGFAYFCWPVVMILMMLESFGREMSAGTFSQLLAQPVPRARIWRTKTLLLAAAALVPLLVWCASYFLHNPEDLKPEELRMMLACVALCMLVVYSGGLWTVLLFRQVTTAFWVMILVPAAVYVTVECLLGNAPDNVQFTTLTAVFTIYGISGILLARRLFFRAQDVAWTGGVINFSSWRYFERGAREGISSRHRRPIAALLKKEFQLHSISLFCACALLALHIAIFFLRIFFVNSHKNSLAAVASDFFWTLWLVVPVILGCSAVAEERRLGMAEAQFCQPVSRRSQFAAKFIPILIFGTLLGGVLPILLETMAAHFGAPADLYKPENQTNYQFGGSDFLGFQISIVALAAGLAWAGFYASTLTRNFLQALGAALSAVLGCVLFTSFIAFVIRNRITFLGITPWHSILPFLIAIPTVPAVLLWLAWLNFSHFREGWHLWRRNLLGFAGAFVFIVATTTALYNRAWEVFEPAELPHGQATFSLSDPPKLLQNDFGDNLLVRLPDGRVWYDSLHASVYDGEWTRWKEIRYYLSPPLPKSDGPRQFIGGSNWVAAVATRVDWWESINDKNTHLDGYLDTVGVKDDGTLWISAESKPIAWTGAKMIRFGGETNWQQIGGRARFLLLKTDGTLWRWGRTNKIDWSECQTNWPSVRTFQPRQIGTNSDWKEILPSNWNNIARKADGSVWHIWESSGKDVLERATNLDQVVFQTCSFSFNGCAAYIGKDGTLWARIPYWNNGQQVNRGFLQIGNETNWMAVVLDPSQMVALKSDGTLWKADIEWDITSQHSISVAFKIPPTRLGIHNDWVAIGGYSWHGSVSLAADGSLWFWPGANSALLKPPKQPQYLGNVFGKAD
jgi:ABC-type transport system involved in multi-copper enzyme maturation permease subunit